MESIEIEIWKDIEGYEGIYQISNLGKVKSLSRFKRRVEKLRVLILSKPGYLRVKLSKDKINKYFFVHRLAAEAFIFNTHDKPYINHLDKDKSNNKINNLEWCTQSENVIYGWQNGRISNNIKKVVRKTLNGKFLKTYLKLKDTKNDGFNWNCVGLCCRGKQKKHKGYLWEFAGSI